MNIKKLGLITLLSAASLLAACTGGGTSSSSTTSSGGGGSTSGETSIPEGYVRVYFYVDFTQPDTGEYYSYQDVVNGGKVSKPDNPTAKFAEFPNFLGWSYKELISSKDDLWDFSNNSVVPDEGLNTFKLYGIWGAEGEN